MNSFRKIVFILFVFAFINESNSENKFGCKYDISVCEVYEYCNYRVSRFGRCELAYEDSDEKTELTNINERKRIDEYEDDGEEYVQPLVYDRMPIRLHKYNIDLDDDDDDDDDNDVDVQSNENYKERVFNRLKEIYDEYSSDSDEDGRSKRSNNAELDEILDNIAVQEVDDNSDDVDDKSKQVIEYIIGAREDARSPQDDDEYLNHVLDLLDQKEDQVEQELQEQQLQQQYDEDVLLKDISMLLMDKLVASDDDKIAKKDAVVPKASKKQSHDEQLQHKTDSDKYMVNENTNDDNYVYIEVENRFKDDSQALNLLRYLARALNMPDDAFRNISVDNHQILFKFKQSSDYSFQTTKYLIEQISKQYENIKKQFNINIKSCGIAKSAEDIQIRNLIDSRSKYYVTAIIVICVTITTLLLLIIALIVVKRRTYLREKNLLNDTSFKSLSAFAGIGVGKTDDTPGLLADGEKKKRPWWLCGRGNEKKEKEQDETEEKLNETIEETAESEEKVEPLPEVKLQPIIQSRITSINSTETKTCDSNRSSTSSWSEEPVSTVNMDITTGHVILNYMEEHLKDKSRIGNEWESLCKYVAEPNSTDIANSSINVSKNRYNDAVPYDHSRVILQDCDYINASAITDHDPKNPAYIATQGPLVHTTQEFWQMVWEQSSVVIVCLCKSNEYGLMKCNQYWPSNGCEIYNKFEVNLVSEHLWCEDYLIRSFYLKNLQTNETRTVTQFHFLSWQDNDVPSNVKSVLDFRSDGVGRTGTYILIDMVLNRITKGAKEIDIAATLEFLRDQRPNMVKTKEQFEFAFAVVTEELQNMLKALTQ